MMYVIEYPDGSSANYSKSEWKLFKEGILNNNCSVTLFHENGKSEVIQKMKFSLKLRFELLFIRLKYVVRLFFFGLSIAVLSLPHFIIWLITGHKLINKIANYINVKRFKDYI